MNDAVAQGIERLKIFRSRVLGLTQEDFAERLDLSKSNYARIESGRGTISYALFLKLLEEFKLNPVWLLTGKGEMYVELSEESPNIGEEIAGQEATAATRLTQLEQRLAVLEESQELIRELIKQNREILGKE